MTEGADAVATGETLVLRASRRKWLLMFTGAALFVALGFVIAIVQHNAFGWVAVFFFGLGLIVAGWQLIAPGQLVVFDHLVDCAKRMGRANKGFAGRSGSLPDTYGMNAVVLVTLLNKARAAALARTNTTA